MATKKATHRKKAPAKKAAAKRVSVKKVPTKKAASKKASVMKAPVRTAAGPLKFATKEKLAVDGDAIARALAKELPGWTRVTTRPATGAIVTDTAARSIPGATMTVLRTKFLGASAGVADGVSDSLPGKPYGKPNKKRVPVQVQSTSGSVKVADLVRGKLKIVQG